MSSAPFIDLASGRTDINTYAYDLIKKEFHVDNDVGIWGTTDMVRIPFDYCIAIAVYCPAVRKHREELMQMLDMFDLFDEKALNKLIVDYVVGLQLSDITNPATFPSSISNMESVNNNGIERLLGSERSDGGLHARQTPTVGLSQDWYYTKFDKMIVPHGCSLYFNYKCVVYCYGIYISNRDFILRSNSPPNIEDTKMWVNNLLNSNVGLDAELDNLVRGTETRVVAGVNIPENTDEIEIKFLNNSRYKLDKHALYALSLLTGRKNYIPFGNALNISRVEFVTYELKLIGGLIVKAWLNPLGAFVKEQSD